MENTRMTEDIEKNIIKDIFLTDEELETLNTATKNKEFVELITNLFYRNHVHIEVLNVLTTNQKFRDLDESKQRQLMNAGRNRAHEQQSKDDSEKYLNFYLSDHSEGNKTYIYYYTNDLVVKQIYKKKLTKIEIENELKEKQVITYSKPTDIIALVALKKVTIYKNKFTGLNTYDITFSGYAGGEISVKGTFQEIIFGLKLNAKVLRKNDIEGALSGLLAEFEKEERAEVRNTLDITGFFFDNKQLIAPPEYEKQVDLDLLRIGLLTFNEAIERFYNTFRGKAITIAKWMLIAPFGFAKKQMEERRESVQKLPHLISQGASDTGKSFTYSLFSMLHLFHNTPLSANSVDTVPRLGKHISGSTFPLIINEADPIFIEKKGNSLRNTIKNLWERTIIRHKYTNSGNSWLHVLGARSLCFTINPPFRFEDAEIRRYIKILYTLKDKKEIKKNSEAFDTFLQNKAKNLEIIGWYAYHLLKEDIGLLSKDFETLAEEMLAKMYAVVNLEIPIWLTERLKFVNEDEITKEDLKVALRDYSIDMIKDNRIPLLITEIFTYEGGSDRTEKIRLPTFEDRIRYFTENNLKTDIYIGEYKETEYYFITKGILPYLVEQDFKIGSLVDLAVLLDGEYGRIDKKLLFGRKIVVFIKKSKLDI